LLNTKLALTGSDSELAIFSEYNSVMPGCRR